MVSGQWLMNWFGVRRVVLELVNWLVVGDMLRFSMVNYLVVRSLVMRLRVSIVMNRLFTVIPLTVN